MASSPSRIHAARANGAKSRGPKTAEGKQIASQNAVTHGLTARTVVLQNESEEEYQTELSAYLDHFRPYGKPETDLVHQLAAAQWRLARYAGVESGLLENKMDDQADWLKEKLEEKYEGISERHRLAFAFEELAGQNGSLALLNRYQARLQREYQRLLKTLIELQAARRAAQAREQKLQNEPKPVRADLASIRTGPPAPHPSGRERDQNIAEPGPDESVTELANSIPPANSIDPTTVASDTVATFPAPSSHWTCGLLASELSALGQAGVPPRSALPRSAPPRSGSSGHARLSFSVRQ